MFRLKQSLKTLITILAIAPFGLIGTLIVGFASSKAPETEAVSSEKPIPSTSFLNQGDLQHVEFHLLNTGHFALEEDGATIAQSIRQFLDTRVVSPGHTHPQDLS